MVRAERAGATRTYARSALARHTRGARRLDTAEQANQHNRSNADAASRCRRLPKCAWIAQQHKHPRSQRAPSDIALTEPDRDMSAGKLVKLADLARTRAKFVFLSATTAQGVKCLCCLCNVLCCVSKSKTKNIYCPAKKISTLHAALGSSVLSSRAKTEHRRARARGASA